MAEEAKAEDLGTGGVPTPTPEPGPTPTPPEELKPTGELQGKKEEEAPVETPVEEVPPKAEDPRPEVERRIQQLTAEKWEERRRREAAEAARKLAEDTLEELAQLSPDIAQRLGRQPESPTGTPVAPSAERRFTQADVHAEAQRLSAEGEFNRRVNDAVLAGRKSHADYDNAIADLKKITGPVVPGEFVMAALETGEASEVIYQLGRNPAEADRILSLPPIPQAIAVAQFAQGIKATRESTKDLEKVSGNELEAAPVVSRAPAPIAPRVGGRRGNGELAIDDPDLPLAEFVRRRNEEERKARSAR